MKDTDIAKLAAALKGNDRDSFASFTAGLRSNWPFILALVAVSMWIFNAFGKQDAVNIQQDAKIEALTLSVTQLTANVVSLASRAEADNQNQNQIQQDIALIKADINAIKETIK